MKMTKLPACLFLAGLAACNEIPEQDEPRTAIPGEASSEERPAFDAVGEVTNTSANAVTIEHGPVPELRWSAMTMAFDLRSASQVDGIIAGDRVSFSFREAGSGYELVSIEKAGS